MYLEREDVLVDRQMLRVQSKTRYDEDGNLLYDYKAKANSEREVPISKELMQRIVNHMNAPGIGREPDPREQTSGEQPNRFPHQGIQEGKPCVPDRCED
jgi:hypothetical protein